jgi:acyl carrier protein
MSPVYNRVVELLTGQFGVAESAIAPEATLEDLDLDSLDVVEFSMVAEEELGVPISDEEAENLVTLDDSVKLLEGKGAEVS